MDLRSKRTALFLTPTLRDTSRGYQFNCLLAEHLCINHFFPTKIDQNLKRSSLQSSDRTSSSQQDSSLRLELRRFILCRWRRLRFRLVTPLIIKLNATPNASTPVAVKAK